MLYYVKTINSKAIITRHDIVCVDCGENILNMGTIQCNATEDHIFCLRSDTHQHCVLIVNPLSIINLNSNDYILFRLSMVIETDIFTSDIKQKYADQIATVYKQVTEYISNRKRIMD